MPSKPNPYNWQRVNPELFYGRTELADKLVQRLVAGESFGITGGRRMGKTTLLRRVERDLLAYAGEKKRGESLIIPIYIETLNLPEQLSLDRIYQAVADLINKQLQLKGYPTSNGKGVTALTFKDYLQSAVNSITQRPQIIFLFDEIEPIVRTAWGSVFFNNWRSLLSNTPDLYEYIAAVFAGASEMFEIARDIGSPLGNILTWQGLKLFSWNDTAQLMRNPSQYDWPDSFVEKMYDVTGGHPFLIQYIMQIVCSDDLIKASQTFEEANSQFLREQRIQFQNWWSRFNNITRAIYAKIAEQNSLPRKTILSGFGDIADRNLSILEHTGVIRIDENTNTITVAGALFKEWFTRFANIEITPTLADLVDTQLKDIERQFRQLLTNHLNQQNYSPEWLRKFYQKDPKVWSRILEYAKGISEAELTNSEILKRLDLGYLFDLVLLGTEWSKLSRIFSVLSPDSKKAKSRLEERKDHLVFVRNKLRHVNEDDLTEGDWLKAQTFCTELLECLSRQ